RDDGCCYIGLYPGVRDIVVISSTGHRRARALIARDPRVSLFTGTFAASAALDAVMPEPVEMRPTPLLALARREIAPLGALTALALALLAFIEIADEVGEGEARWFDEGLLKGLRTADPADPIGPHWLEEIVVEITALGGFGVLALVTVFVLGYLAMQKKWGDGLLVLAATLGGTAISEGLKVGFARPRPDLVAHA